jgi:hypothetical protein
LLWLADLDTASSGLGEEKIAQYSRKTKPPMLEIGNDIINGVNHPIHSLQNLSKKIDDLENNVSKKMVELENSFKLLRNSAYIIAASIAVIASVLRFWPANNVPNIRVQHPKEPAVAISPEADAKPETKSAATPKQ